MTPEELGRVKVAHAEALSLAPAERDAFLRKSFPDEPHLRAEVLLLLGWHDEAGEFLTTPLVDRILGFSARDLKVDRVGPYELVRKLGQGGSASVFLARRIDDLYERQVAIKILSRLSHSEEVFLRFQREAQILARVEHPYIVQMFDADTTGEAVAYIVTEFIEGKRIDDYCTDLPLAAKLRLFLKVCEGVSAAHRNLIVHRDIKASNVLVKNDGTPKLLDFGIALLLDAKGSRLTQTGLDRMTVQCASPEQIRGERDISTLSDVYSLGILLYELLAGRPPYPFPVHELPARILTEDPVPIGVVPFDLEAIVRKALSKEAAQRYESVDRLRDDLTRFLDGQPVLAQGDSVHYRLGKLFKKHWVAVVVTCLIVVLLTTLSVVSVLEARKARQQKARVNQLLTEAFDDASYYPGREYGLRAKETLEVTRLAYLEPLAVENPGDVQLQMQRFKSWRLLGDIQGLPSSLNLGKTAEARRNLERAVRIGETLLMRHLDGGVSPGEVALTHLELGSILIEMNAQDEAEKSFMRAEELASSESTGPTIRIALEALAQKSRILALRGQRTEALALRSEVVKGRRELFEKDPEGMRWEYAGALCSYGELLREMGRLADAEKAYSEGLPLVEGLVRRTPPLLGNQWHVARENEEYAKVLLGVGKEQLGLEHLDRAIMLYREIMRAEPDAISNQRALAVCLSIRGGEMVNRGRRQDGMVLLQEALRFSEQAGRQDPDSVRAHAELTALRATVNEHRF
jgi:serine/threonine protein kinase